MAKGQPSVWFPEAVQIVQENWGVLTPWEIAREVNRFLAQRVIPSRTADDHLQSAVTRPTGTGVVWKAWELGFVPSVEDIDRMMKAAAKGSTPYLMRLCEHGMAFKRCLECYIGWCLGGEHRRRHQG